MSLQIFVNVSTAGVTLIPDSSESGADVQCTSHTFSKVIGFPQPHSHLYATLQHTQCWRNGTDGISQQLPRPPTKTKSLVEFICNKVSGYHLQQTICANAGHHLAQLPVDARVGKLLLLACSLGCLAPALTIAACLSYKSPFSTSADQQEAAQRMKLSLASPGTLVWIFDHVD